MEKRILHIVGRMDRAGAETIIMNLYRNVDRTRYQFDFIYFTDDKCDFDDEIEALGGRIVRLKGANPIQRFWNLFGALRECKWLVVHSHVLFSIGLDMLAARLAKVPVRIAHSHTTDDGNSSSAVGRMYQSVMRWLIQSFATKYVACSGAAAEYLFPGQQNVTLIPNAIDIDRFVNANGSAVRKELDISDDRIVILQVGRLMPVKNHRWAVELAASLRDAGIDFVMLFAGAGPLQPEIESLIKSFDLERQIIILGLREDIPELMNASDVLLFPSVYEGFGVVVAEAQAAGLPAVVSTAIPKEADFGLDMVDYLSLDEPAEHWIKSIVDASQMSEVAPSIRREALVRRGFSSKTGAIRLAEVYQAV